jgi:hypothetical protein
MINGSLDRWQADRSRWVRLPSICVAGFGWKDLHHQWSKYGNEFSRDELFEHLIKKIIPE